MTGLVTGSAKPSHALSFLDDFVMYVGDRSNPSDFDPYFGQPKIYRQPRYYESTSKKKKKQQGVQDYKGRVKS
jgi:hypothetical protein